MISSTHDSYMDVIKSSSYRVKLDLDSIKNLEAQTQFELDLAFV